MSLEIITNHKSSNIIDSEKDPARQLPFSCLANQSLLPYAVKSKCDQEHGIQFYCAQTPPPSQAHFLERAKVYREAFHSQVKECEKITSLRSQLANPNSSSNGLYSQFESILGKEMLALIDSCIPLEKGKANSEVLKNNPRFLLNLMDSYSRGILDALIEYKMKQCRRFNDLVILNSIAATSNKSDINTLINSLSSKVKIQLTKIIIKQNNHLNKNSKLEDIITNNTDLNELNLTNSIKKAIAITERQLNKPFVIFNTHALLEGVQDHDSQDVLNELSKLHQLQNFYVILLSSLPSSKQQAIEAFLKLDQDTQELFYRAAWISCYCPDEPHFGESFLKSNPFFLLQCQNSAGNDIVCQIIDNFDTRVKLRRAKPELVRLKSDLFHARSPSKKLELFYALPEKTQRLVLHILWHEEGGKHNPHFGELGYGDRRIHEDSSLIVKYIDFIEQMLDKPLRHNLEECQKTKSLPQDPIDCSAIPLSQDLALRELAQSDFRVAMVSLELQGAMNVGGVGTAVLGMAKNLGEDRVRVIMPKYDTLPSSIQMKKKEKYQLVSTRNSLNVFKSRVNGIRCYFIEDMNNFTIGFNNENKPNNIYTAVDNTALYKRWAHFQSAAVTLGDKFSKKEKHPTKVLHLHCAQTALIPKLMQTRQNEEWKKGETPATVLTYHGAADQITFNSSEHSDILNEIGLPNQSLSSMIEGIQHCEMLTAVSETNAKEIQTPLYGDGLERFMKIKASQGKLIGILNGSNDGWDPKTDPQLKNWISHNGEPIDLTYGPDDADLPQKLQRIREELAAYLSRNHLGKIDPQKPIFLYLGRYCTFQKGIDKLPVIMEEALKTGAQFISIGIDPSPEADKILKKMEKRAAELNHEGVCIIRDWKRKDGRYHWQQGNSSFQDHSGVQGFGSLLRAGIDVGIFPSKFEPCGYVQGEMHRMGKMVVATATGGFNDTISTTGPNRNGFLYPRLEKWDSEDQDRLIQDVVKEAADEAKLILNELYENDNQPMPKPRIEQMRRIMHNAASSTWKTTIDGSLSSIDRMKLVYAKAMRDSKHKRDVIPLDLHTFRK